MHLIQHDRMYTERDKNSQYSAQQQGLPLDMRRSFIQVKAETPYAMISRWSVELTEVVGSLWVQ
jgi:hypothetical protein